MAPQAPPLQRQTHFIRFYRQVNTMFLLHTKENPTREQFLSYTNASSFRTSNFKATRKTKVIIHGFGSSCYRVWVREMRETFLNKVSVLSLLSLSLYVFFFLGQRQWPRRQPARQKTRIINQSIKPTQTFSYCVWLWLLVFVYYTSSRVWSLGWVIPFLHHIYLSFKDIYDLLNTF